MLDFLRYAEEEKRLGNSQVQVFSLKFSRKHPLKAFVNWERFAPPVELEEVPSALNDLHDFIHENSRYKASMQMHHIDPGETICFLNLRVK